MQSLNQAKSRASWDITRIVVSNTSAAIYLLAELDQEQAVISTVNKVFSSGIGRSLLFIS
jgi:hypothetical protein